MTDWSILTKFVDDVGTHALPFLGAMGAVGTLSMAIVQTGKDIFPFRNWFQKWWLETWLKDKAAKAEPIGKTKPDIVKAEADLIRLATAGDRKAFYDLAIEQLCGQMNAAAQSLLDYPDKYPDLLRCLAALAEPDDIAEVLKPAISGQPKPQAMVDARARVIHQVQRSIDGFQISAGFRWKWILQISSFFFSFMITSLGLELHSGEVFGNTVMGGIIPRAFKPPKRTKTTFKPFLSCCRIIIHK